MTEAAVSRRHYWLLGGLVAIAIARGLFWAAVTPVPGPIDEAHHFAYVHALVHEGAIPVVGEDRVPAEVLTLMKSAPTSTLQAQVGAGPPTDPSWGAVAHQYEGHQPPAFYALLALPLALLDDASLAEAVLWLRAVSVLLAALGVVAAYLLARAALPGLPRAWLVAPALLVFVQGFNASTAAVTNDALVPACAAAVLIPVARAWHLSFTRANAVLTGVLMGVALLVKATTAGVVALIALALIAALVTRKARLRDLLVWGVIAVAVAAVLVAPWVAYNLRVYPGASASRIVYQLVTAELQPPLTFNAAAIANHVRSGISGFWESQLVNEPLVTPTRVAWFGVLLLAGVVGLWFTVRPPPAGPARAGSRIVWLAAALPSVFAVHLGIVYTAAFGGTITSGRLLYAALIPTVVAIAGALALLLRRWAVVAAACLIVFVATTEVSMIHRFVEQWYTLGIAAGDLVPTTDQTWNDGWVRARPIVLDPPCPTTLVGVTVAGTVAPAAAVIRADDAAILVALHSSESVAGGLATRARFAVPEADEPIRISLPGSPPIGRSERDRSDAIAFVSGDGDPMATVYCYSSTPEADRFQQLFAPNHPPLTYAFVRGWPWLWAGLACVGAVLAVLGALARDRGSGPGSA